jgi:SagB-type dehydrogenase family enzyme
VPQASPPPEFRRSPHLLLHWRGERLELHDYGADRTIRAPVFLVEVLEYFRRWRPIQPYLDTVPPAARSTVRRLVHALHRQRFLRRRDESLPAPERRMDEWSGWNPAAGYFHSKTRNNAVVDVGTIIANVQRQARSRSAPRAVKVYVDADRVALPAAETRGAFPDVLRARRTWRRFSSAPVDLSALSTLLHLSAGVQEWVMARGEGRVALKTSPSGGARHPIEVYVAARNVAALPAGLYHYAAGDHALERLPRPGRLPRFDTFLPTQWWYREAAALVFFTAVFERTRWRYQGPRAYRAVLLEAGHVCQTLCLTATWLGLAPFCSMALSDAAIERALGLDGISESVLYAAGVGMPPAQLDGARPGALPRPTTISLRTPSRTHGHTRR